MNVDRTAEDDELYTLVTNTIAYENTLGDKIVRDSLHKAFTKPMSIACKKYEKSNTKYVFDYLTTNEICNQTNNAINIIHNAAYCAVYAVAYNEGFRRKLYIHNTKAINKLSNDLFDDLCDIAVIQVYNTRDVAKDIASGLFDELYTKRDISDGMYEGISDGIHTGITHRISNCERRQF